MIPGGGYWWPGVPLPTLTEADLKAHDWDALPMEESQDWSYGWKVGHLIIFKESEIIAFKPIVQSPAFIYQVDDVAHCVKYKANNFHKPPSQGCSCGFYSFETRPQAEYYFH